MESTIASESTSGPRSALSILDAHIGEAEALLRRCEPERADTLARERAAATERDKTAAPGLVAPDAGEAPAGGKPTTETGVSVLTTWAAALDSAATRARALMPELRARLERADTIELVSELIAAAGSSALLATLVSDASEGLTAQVTAGVTFAGAVAAIVARFLRRGIGGRANRLDDYEQLATLSSEAAILAVDIAVWRDQGSDESEQIATRARDVVRHMLTILNRY